MSTPLDPVCPNHGAPFVLSPQNGMYTCGCLAAQVNAYAQAVARGAPPPPGWIGAGRPVFNPARGIANPVNARSLGSWLPASMPTDPAVQAIANLTGRLTGKRVTPEDLQPKAKPRRCECGSGVQTKGPVHSTWCWLFERY